MELSSMVRQKITREEAAESMGMADHAGHVRQLAGWSEHEIKLLLENNESPDHWFDDPVPTFALLEAIRSAIDKSDTMSYRQTFPTILDCLDLKQPAHIVGLISKINRRIVKVKKTGDYIPLCEEVPGLSKLAKESIGPACNNAGITPTWLENEEELGLTGDYVVITIQIIVELKQYRARKGFTWKKVTDKWWTKLFPGTKSPPLGTVTNSWEQLAARKHKVSRNSSKVDRDNFLASTYVLPVPRPQKANDAAQPDNRGTKRKCPFPGDNIVTKRVRHICLSPGGTKLVTYMGKVLRVSSALDIEELMEEEYRSYYDEGYAFYTVVYDSPYNQIYIYPLQKEWEDDLLSVL